MVPLLSSRLPTPFVALQETRGGRRVTNTHKKAETGRRRPFSLLRPRSTNKEDRRKSGPLHSLDSLSLFSAQSALLGGGKSDGRVGVHGGSENGLICLAPKLSLRCRQCFSFPQRRWRRRRRGRREGIWQIGPVSVFFFPSSEERQGVTAKEKEKESTLNQDFWQEPSFSVLPIPFSTASPPLPFLQYTVSSWADCGQRWVDGRAKLHLASYSPSFFLRRQASAEGSRRCYSSPPGPPSILQRRMQKKRTRERKEDDILWAWPKERSYLTSEAGLFAKKSGKIPVLPYPFALPTALWINICKEGRRGGVEC